MPDGIDHIDTARFDAHKYDAGKDIALGLRYSMGLMIAVATVDLVMDPDLGSQLWWTILASVGAAVLFTFWLSSLWIYLLRRWNSKFQPTVHFADVESFGIRHVCDTKDVLVSWESIDSATKYLDRFDCVYRVVLKGDGKTLEFSSRLFDVEAILDQIRIQSQQEISWQTKRFLVRFPAIMKRMNFRHVLLFAVIISVLTNLYKKLQ